MKIKILSDLHLEYGKHDFTYQYHGEDVLILAGDISSASSGGRTNFEYFIETIPNHVEIIKVAGNHTYYRGSFDRVNSEIKSIEDKYPNFHFLLDQSLTLKDVNFFGGTMYTDLQLFGNDPLVEIDVKHGINDFEWITKNDKARYRKWSVEDHKSCHEKYCFELAGWLKRTEGCKRVVISHFVPTEKAVHPQYRMSRLNPYFTSDMERFMGWEGFWVFGHTHSSYRGKIGDTELICNPKGYSRTGNSENHDFDPELIFEI